MRLKRVARRWPMLGCAYGAELLLVRRFLLHSRNLAEELRRSGEASTERATECREATPRRNRIWNEMMARHHDTRWRCIHRGWISARATEQFLNSTPSQPLSAAKFVPSGPLSFIIILHQVVKRELT